MARTNLQFGKSAEEFYTIIDAVPSGIQRNHPNTITFTCIYNNLLVMIEFEIVQFLSVVWTVCHLSVVESSARGSPDLYLTRYISGKEPVIMKLSGFTKDKVRYKWSS